MFKTTAFDLWREEQKIPKLVTLCSDLDKQLGGGLSCCKITEFCGGPGTGKTQMCLQLCLTVQFPNGLNGKAIYIDTNQDFSPERFKELAAYFSKRFQKVFQNEPYQTYSVENFLDNVSYSYCANYKQLLAYIILLPNILMNDSKIKLIVIDSFSYLIRKVDEGVSERTSILYKILTELYKIAKEFNIIVVITNELTTHFTGNEWIIRPALGNIHLHKINNRILLSKFEKCRYAFVAKSFKLLYADIDLPIKINANGIRSLQIMN